MCEGCNEKAEGLFGFNVSGKIDPTKTLTLRNRFSRAMVRRIDLLLKDIRASIIDNDAFGFAVDISKNFSGYLEAAPRNKFYFERSADRVEAFMDWLAEQERRNILEIIRRPGTIQGLYENWTDTYIQSAYAKGIFRARAELKNAGFEIQSVEDIGGITYLMNQPIHADRIGALYTRTFEDLRTVMSQADAETRRELIEFLTNRLTRGIAEGKNPNQIARELYNDLRDTQVRISKKRAKMIARTEVIRAHHVANITEFRRADADMKVEVLAEWVTAGDFRVCPICAGFSGKVFTLDEAYGMLPAHPNCRCTVVPILSEKKSQKVA